MKKFIITLSSLAIGSMMTIFADGEVRPVKPARTAPIDRTEVSARRAALQKSATASTSAENMLMAGFNNPHHGECKQLVILMQFEDRKFTTPNAQEYYTKLLNEEGYSDNLLPGSVREYFIENSNGQYKPTFDVYGPITTYCDDPGYESYTVKDYIGYEGYAVQDACYILAHQPGVDIDFSQYDSDGDHLIDNVIVIFAGQGAGDTGAPSVAITPHQYFEYWGPSDPTQNNGWAYDGVYVNSYSMTPELVSNYYYATDPGTHNDVGSLVHEFGHSMGLPDLYSLHQVSDPGFYWTPSEWDVMDIGCYLPVPPSYSSLERYMFGWIEPEVAQEKTSYVLSPLTESNRALIIPNENNYPGHEEFYLIEARSKSVGKWDSWIPGSGLLIWHIDYNKKAWDGNSVSTDYNHPGVALMRADGKFSAYGKDLGSNPYPGTNGTYTSFTPYSSYGGEYSATFERFPITNIRRVDSPEGGIAFDIAGGGNTGISDITTGENVTYRYYDLRGIEVNPDNAAAGIYIRRGSDASTSKIVIR